MTEITAWFNSFSVGWGARGFFFCSIGSSGYFSSFSWRFSLELSDSMCPQVSRTLLSIFFPILIILKSGWSLLVLLFPGLQVPLTSLGDSKSPLISRTLLSILAELNNALIRMVSTFPLISMFSSFFIEFERQQTY